MANSLSGVINQNVLAKIISYEYFASKINSMIKFINVSLAFFS